MTMVATEEKERRLLTLVGEERTGRQVAKAYEAAYGERILYGTVYAIFESLEARGLVVTRNTNQTRYIIASAPGSL